MEELHKDFLNELKDLLKSYDAEICINRDMYDQQVIEIEFNSNEKREYSSICISWIDDKDYAIKE